MSAKPTNPRSLYLRYQGLRDAVSDLDAIWRGPPPSSSVTPCEFTKVADTGIAPIDSSKTGGSEAGDRVAVMSFSNLTRNPGDDWLGAGIAETVTTDLKYVPRIRVVGRERVLEVLRRLNPTNRPDLDNEMVMQAGREIGVRWMIHGGFQRFGDVLRITSGAIDVSIGEISDYEACSKGYSNLLESSAKSIERAVSFCEQAISLDPNYARAYVVLGRALSVKAQYETSPGLYESAITNLRKAESLRPLKADENAALGLALIAMGRDGEAMAALNRAIVLDPYDAMIRTVLGRVYFIGKGQFGEAAAEFERALALDPKHAWAALQLAHCCAYLGAYERGEQAARLAITGQEEFQSGKGGLSRVQSCKGIGLFVQKYAGMSSAKQKTRYSRPTIRSKDTIRGKGRKF